MIVSDRYRFVFIHNPKAAGTSVRRMLAPFDDARPKFWKIGFNPALRRWVDRAHIPLEDLERGYPKVFPKLRTYWSFAFVRNPYTRAVSAFAEWCVHKRMKARLADRAWVGAFRDYVAALDPRHFRESPTWIHACPQHHFVLWKGERLCRFIGRVERFDEDYRVVARQLGLDDGAPLERCNVSAKRRGETSAAPPRSGDPYGGAGAWYDRATAARIEALYADDFDLFGYAKAET